MVSRSDGEVEESRPKSSMRTVRAPEDRFFDAVNSAETAMDNTVYFENNKESIFNSFRRGCLDLRGDVTSLNAPRFTEDLVEAGWVFLLQFASAKLRRKLVLETAGTLLKSEKWRLVVLESQRVQKEIEKLPADSKDSLRKAISRGDGTEEGGKEEAVHRLADQSKIDRKVSNTSKVGTEDDEEKVRRKRNGASRKLRKKQSILEASAKGSPAASPQQQAAKPRPASAVEPPTRPSRGMFSRLYKDENVKPAKGETKASQEEAAKSTNPKLSTFEEGVELQPGQLSEEALREREQEEIKRLREIVNKIEHPGERRRGEEWTKTERQIIEGLKKKEFSECNPFASGAASESEKEGEEDVWWRTPNGGEKNAPLPPRKAKVVAEEAERKEKVKEKKNEKMERKSLEDARKKLEKDQKVLQLQQNQVRRQAAALLEKEKNLMDLEKKLLSMAEHLQGLHKELEGGGRKGGGVAFSELPDTSGNGF